jgi:plastocyanin
MDHTVTADPRLAPDPSHVMLPAGAEPFNSGSIKHGQVYRRTFTVAGDYHYFCIPHHGQGMMGMLRVRARG